MIVASNRLIPVQVLRGVCCCLVTSPVQCFCNPMKSIGPSVCEISQARILGRVAISFCRGLLDPGIKPVSPELAGGFSALSHLGSLRRDLGVAKGGANKFAEAPRGFRRLQVWSPEDNLAYIS